MNATSGPLGTARVLLAWEIGLASLFGLFYWLLTRKFSESRWVDIASYALFGCFVAYGAVRFVFDGGMNNAVMFAIVVASGQHFSRSIRGFATVTALSVFAWLAVILQTGPALNTLVAAAGFPLALVVLRTAKRAGQPQTPDVEQPSVEAVRPAHSEPVASISQAASPEHHFPETHRELAVAGSNDGLWHLDVVTNKLSVSGSWAAMLGKEPCNIGDSLNDWLGLIHPHHLARFRTDLESHIAGRSAKFENVYQIRKNDGNYVWVHCRGQAILGPTGTLVSLAGSQTDIDRIKQFEHRLVHDALRDRLTGLANRTFFNIELRKAAERTTRNPNYEFALIFLDLDNFKSINDRLGHLAGDLLLAGVAGRIRSCQRARDTVARLGGDEFVVLLDGVVGPDEAVAVGKRIQRELSSPFLVGDREVLVTASIGIVTSRTRFSSSKELVKHADVAMYRAKTARSGEICVFTDDMYDDAIESNQLRSDLRRALSRDELVLHYQALVTLQTGSIANAEALVRWRRSDGELLRPARFLSQVEEMGLINELGDWVLLAVCEQIRRWQEAAIPPLRVGVNISARQLQSPGFNSSVDRILKQTGVDPHLLEFEITEAALTGTVDVTRQNLAWLTERGIRLSIDDFGTGYSSLHNLRRFSFDTLKIDSSFIAEIGIDPRAGSLTKAIIGLAHSLDLNVIAEGVESRQQLDFLNKNSCDIAQGYLFSRPIDSDQFTKLLKVGGEEFSRDLLARSLVGSRTESLLESTHTAGA